MRQVAYFSRTNITVFRGIEVDIDKTLEKLQITNESFFDDYLRVLDINEIKWTPNGKCSSVLVSQSNEPLYAIDEYIDIDIEPEIPWQKKSINKLRHLLNQKYLSYVEFNHIRTKWKDHLVLKKKCVIVNLYGDDCTFYDMLKPVLKQPTNRQKN